MTPPTTLRFRVVTAAIITVLGLCLSAFPVLASDSLEVHSAIIMDMGTGRILYEQNADDQIPPASLTKVMSMFVAMDKIRSGKASINDQVKISKRAAGTGGSRMFLTSGERVSLDELLTGMAVSSGNDASTAVAEHIGGSTDGFVRLMNAKAQSLGMKQSIFRNVHGLPAAGQMTSARDMLTLSRAYLQQYPEALRYHSIRYIKHNRVITTNKNPLLGNVEGADGLKTGWVCASGYNLISTVKRGKTRLLAVVLGAQNTQLRAQETHRLIEAGFQVAEGENKSVATALATMRPHDFALNTHKTKSLAYAELNKDTKHKRGKSALRAKHSRKNTAVSAADETCQPVASKSSKSRSKSSATASKGKTTQTSKQTTLQAKPAPQQSKSAPQAQDKSSKSKHAKRAEVAGKNG